MCRPGGKWKPALQLHRAEAVYEKCRVARPCRVLNKVPQGFPELSRVRDTAFCWPQCTAREVYTRTISCDSHISLNTLANKETHLPSILESSFN